MDTNSFLVNVSCMTYNHASYIVDTMKGFCMQVTTFPFICIIVDDASSDGEQLVISNYVNENFNIIGKSLPYTEETDDYNLTFAQHKKNNNCYFAVYYLKYNHYSIKKRKQAYYKRWSNVKYSAICEGDDYWIDPLKLQKQVDVMERNEDVGMTHTDCALLNEDINTLQHYINRYISDNISIDTSDWDNSISAYYHGKLLIRTCTALIRTQLLETVHNTDPFLFDDHLLLGDTQTWVGILLQKKKFVYFDEETAVYRVHSGSASHSTSYQKKLSFSISRYEIRLYYKRKYGILKEFPNIEKKYYQYIRIYRFLYDPCYRDIDGNIREPNSLLRLLSKSIIMRYILTVLLNFKHKVY